MQIKLTIKHLEIALYHTRKWVWFVSLAVLIFLSVAGGIAQYWLPRLVADKARVEQYLGDISKQKIAIGKLHTLWDGIYPGIRATDIVIQNPDLPQSSISFKEVRLSLSYLSILKGKPTLHRLILVEPELEVARDRDGKVNVSGIRTRDRSLAQNQPGSTGATAVNWLFAQGEVVLQNGKVHWFDSYGKAGKAGEQFKLDKVNLTLKNSGDRHELEFTGEFPEEICIECSFSMDIEGNPLVTKDWGGFVNVNAIGLNLDTPLSILSNRLPGELAGKVDLVLRSQWAQGRPRLAYGRVTANDLTVPLGKIGNSISINEMISTIKWRSRQKNWSLEMDLPFVRINNQSWLPGKLSVNRYADGTGFYLRHLNIEKVISIASRFNVPEKLMDFVSILKPGGSVDELFVDLKDKGAEGERVKVKANLRRLHWSPYKKIPGVKGLSASFETTDKAGEIYLNSSQSEFNSTHVFRGPIPVNRAKARINWQNKNNIIEINTQNLQMVGRDLSARGGFVFRYPLDKKISPELDLRAEFFDGVVAQKSLYLPVNVLKPKLLAWLDRSVISGKLVDGHIVYRGKVREFPFLHNNGLFEVMANVEHGKLKYLPAWKPVSSANMKLLFRGRSMIITSSHGKVGGLDVNEIVARKNNLKNKREPIRISGRLVGPVNQAISVLRDAVANGQKGGWTKFIESDVRASGLGELSLGIEIPALKGKSYRLDGQYNFLGGGIILPVGDISANALRGSVRFNQKRVVNGFISGNTFGGPVDIRVSGGVKASDPETRFDLSGRMTTRGLANEYGGWISQYFKGSIPWSGQVSFKNGIPNVSLQGKMSDVSVNLPSPAKQFSKSSDSFLIESAVGELKRHVLKFSLGNQLSGLLDYHAQGAQLRFAEGRMLIGEGLAALTGDDGFHMEFRGDELKAEDWVSIIYAQKSGNGMPGLVKGVQGRFQNIAALGRDWGNAEFDLRRSSNTKWVGTLDGSAAQGKVQLDTGPWGGKIALDLNRLHFPKARDKAKKEKTEVLDPRKFPTLDVVSLDVTAGAMNLGRLDFSAEHTRIGWEIKQFQLTRPDLSIFADGTWFRVAGNHVTRGRMRLTSSNLGRSLAALGNPNVVTGGTLNMDASINWRQDSRHKGLENLNGEISLKAKDGKINKLETGPVRAAGAFSLSALSKYLSLDFSSTLGKGFAFDEIRGKVSIQKGDAKTDGFTVTAPIASIVAAGHVNLHKKNIDMRADIYPTLKGGVTVAAGSVFGLQAAAWALALQQLFSSEIEKGTRISYTIKGSLDKPKVTKIVGRKKRKTTGTDNE